MLSRVTDFVVWLRDLMDRFQLARTVMLYGTLYMTWRYFAWTIVFAETSSRSGVEIAAILGATGVPVSALQGYVFKAYLDGRP